MLQYEVTKKGYDLLIGIYNEMFRLGLHKYRKLIEINKRYYFNCDTIEEFNDFKRRGTEYPEFE